MFAAGFVLRDEIAQLLMNRLHHPHAAILPHGISQHGLEGFLLHLSRHWRFGFEKRVDKRRMIIFRAAGVAKGIV